VALVCFAVEFVVGLCIFFRVWRCISPVHRFLVRSDQKTGIKEVTLDSELPVTSLLSGGKSVPRLEPVVERAKRDLHDLDTFREIAASGRIFLSQKRSEANFIKDNVAEGLVLPRACPKAERAKLLVAPLTLTIVLLRNRGNRNMFWNAVGVGLMVSSLFPLVWLGEMQGSGSAAVDFLSVVRSHLKLSVDGFKFFVAFLLLGLLNFVVGRWREYLVAGQRVQSKAEDLGVAIGAAVIDGTNATTRRHLFQLYRWINTVHAMTYAGVDGLLPRTADGYCALGLLTATEAKILSPLAPCAVKSAMDKQRDALLGWVGGLLGRMVRDGALHGAFSPPSQGMVNGLRAACTAYDDLGMRHMPNLWLACTHTLMVFVFILVDLTIAFDLSHTELGAAPRGILLCGSLTAFLGATIVSQVYMLAWAMIEELSHPFEADSDDRYNFDAWLGSTECSLFASLRSSFDRPLLESEFGGPYGPPYASLESEKA